MPGAGDHAGRPELDVFCPLGDCGQQIDRLPARLGKETVADPDGVKPQRLCSLGQREEVVQPVSGGEQRFTVVEIDAKLESVPIHFSLSPVSLVPGSCATAGSPRWLAGAREYALAGGGRP